MADALISYALWLAQLVLFMAVYWPYPKPLQRDQDIAAISGSA